MATNENKVLMSGKDASGNMNLIYPITMLDCVDGAGSLENLETTVKSDLVSAINELVSVVKNTIHVPSSTTDDNGKFLRVVEGVAAWDTVINAEEVAY